MPGPVSTIPSRLTPWDSLSGHLPASACWTLLALGICTGTEVGALPGLLEEGPLGKEALGEKREQTQWMAAG